MKVPTLAAFLLPLGALTSPVATPVEAEALAPQAGFCNIVVPYGVAVNCYAEPNDKSRVVYKFSTALYQQFECFTTANGSGWFRTRSMNGVCLVRERDLVEGPLCRSNIFGVIC